MGGKDFQENGVSIDDEGYETYLLPMRSVGIFVSAIRKPFFVYMPFIAPHTPLDAPEELKEKYKDIETDLAPARSNQTDSTRRIAKLTLRESARPMYAAVVDAMDQAIGQVLDTLDSEGLTDNTIVLFSVITVVRLIQWVGQTMHRFAEERETFEGGIRVVSLMRWPEKLAPAQVFDQIMTVMDVFPTLADAAGIEPLNNFEFDGASLWPSIQDGVVHERDDLIMFASEIPIMAASNSRRLMMSGSWFRRWNRTSSPRQ